MAEMAEWIERVECLASIVRVAFELKKTAVRRFIRPGRFCG